MKNKDWIRIQLLLYIIENKINGWILQYLQLSSRSIYNQWNGCFKIGLYDFLHVTLLYVFLVPAEFRRGHKILWNLSFRWMWAPFMCLGNRTWDLWKNSQYFKCLSCFSSLNQPFLEWVSNTTLKCCNKLSNTYVISHICNKRSISLNCYNKVNNPIKVTIGMSE